MSNTLIKKNEFQEYDPLNFSAKKLNRNSSKFSNYYTEKVVHTPLKEIRKGNYSQSKKYLNIKQFSRGANLNSKTTKNLLQSKSDSSIKQILQTLQNALDDIIYQTEELKKENKLKAEKLKDQSAAHSQISDQLHLSVLNFNKLINDNIKLSNEVKKLKEKSNELEEHISTRVKVFNQERVEITNLTSAKMVNSRKESENFRQYQVKCYNSLLNLKNNVSLIEFDYSKLLNEISDKQYFLKYKYSNEKQWQNIIKSQTNLIRSNSKMQIK